MNEHAIEKHNGNGEVALRAEHEAGLAMTFRQMRQRVEALDSFYRGVMQENTDYGVIPGTPKPSLYQPGAQLLDGIFGLAPTFLEQPSSIRDYDRGFFAIDIVCRLVNKNTGVVVAEAIGHCNSKEDRYRWRAAKRTCPQCGAEAIIKGKQEFGGGWLCFKKQDGCGAKFRDGDPAIEKQPAGRVENDDPYTLVNTVLKMAEKRAHVAATLNATGASRIFTQDVEDLPEFQREAPRQEPQNAAPAAPQSQPNPARAPASAAQTRPASPPERRETGEPAAPEPAEGEYTESAPEEPPADTRIDDGHTNVLEETPARGACRWVYARMQRFTMFARVPYPEDADEAALSTWHDAWLPKVEEAERAAERRAQTAAGKGR